MIRSLLRSVIPSATVTRSEAIALQLDPFILHAAELLPREEVELVNLATGARLRTFVEVSVEGSGEVAAPFRAGDRIAILSFAQLHEGQTLAHKAKVVTLDEANRVIAIVER
jgi:aspartate 1-decarboxylase